MSTEKTLHPDEKVKAGTLGKRLAGAGAAILVIFLILSIILGASKGDHWRRFFHAYVIGWSFVASIAIGSLFFVIIHHLVRAQWSTVVRRLAEIVTGSFPLLFVVGLGFIIPVAAGYDGLYYWGHHDAHHAANHHLHGKLGWLSGGAFALRYAIYFAIYIGLSRYFAGTSRKQDESGDEALSEKMRIAAGPMVILYGITTVFFGFDILMSLQPKWYSTIYSVNFWGGAMIGAYATLALLAMAVQRSGRLTRSITVEHYQDLGKWVFAYTFFWAYTAFSQFMLIWYANIPEETIFYKYRMFSEWKWLLIAITVGHWAFLFVFLLSRWTKRILPVFTFFCVWQLGFHWLDLYWNVMPNINWSTVTPPGGAPFVGGPLMGNPADHTIGFSPVDVTMWVAMIGALLAGIGLAMKGNLIPVRDPKLGKSLAFENF